MRTSEKPWRLAAASIALAVGAVACGGGSDGAASGEDRTVRIAGTQAYIPTLPAFHAAETGLFDEFDVDAEVTNFEGGSASLEALAAGEADLINYFPAGLAQAMTRDVDAVVVAIGSERPNGYGVVVPESSSATTLADLAGSDVGVTSAGATTDYYARDVFGEAGVEATFVPIGGSAMIPSLVQGNVDAILAFPPLGWQLEAEGEGRFIADLAEDSELLFPDVWIASRELVEDRPEVLRDALRAIYTSVERLQADREMAVEAIIAAAGYSPETAERTFDETILGLSVDGTFTPEQMESSILLAEDAADGDLPDAAEVATSDFVPVEP